MGNPGLVIGQTSELTIVTDMNAGEVEVLRGVLQKLNEKRIFVVIETIHFARFVIVSPPGEDPFLLFHCNYDGEFETLLAELVLKLPNELSSIWSHTRDWQGMQQVEQFKTWVLKHAKRALLAYTPYPMATVKEIRRGLRVDNAAQELFDAIRSDPAAHNLLEALES